MSETSTTTHDIDDDAHTAAIAAQASSMRKARLLWLAGGVVAGMVLVVIVASLSLKRDSKAFVVTYQAAMDNLCCSMPEKALDGSCAPFFDELWQAVEDEHAPTFLHQVAVGTDRLLGRRHVQDKRRFHEHQLLAACPGVGVHSRTIDVNDTERLGRLIAEGVVPPHDSSPMSAMSRWDEVVKTWRTQRTAERFTDVDKQVVRALLRSRTATLSAHAVLAARHGDDHAFVRQVMFDKSPLLQAELFIAWAQRPELHEPVAVVFGGHLVDELVLARVERLLYPGDDFFERRRLNNVVVRRDIDDALVNVGTLFGHLLQRQPQVPNIVLRRFNTTGHGKRVNHQAKKLTLTSPLVDSRFIWAVALSAHPEGRAAACRVLVGWWKTTIAPTGLMDVANARCPQEVRAATDNPSGAGGSLLFMLSTSKTLSDENRKNLGDILKDVSSLPVPETP